MVKGQLRSLQKQSKGECGDRSAAGKAHDDADARAQLKREEKAAWKARQNAQAREAKRAAQRQLYRESSAYREECAAHEADAAAVARGDKDPLDLELFGDDGFDEWRRTVLCPVDDDLQSRCDAELLGMDCFDDE